MSIHYEACLVFKSTIEYAFISVKIRVIGYDKLCKKSMQRNCILQGNCNVNGHVVWDVKSETFQNSRPEGVTQNIGRSFI